MNLERSETLRALLPGGDAALARGREVLARLDLVRVDDRVLGAVGVLLPAELRSLDAIHLATAQLLGSDLGPFVTYDDRLAQAARRAGVRVTAPR